MLNGPKRRFPIRAETLYPKIAACAGPAGVGAAGVDVSDTAATQPFCAAGWHVCTGSDINAGRNDASHHTAVTREMAIAFEGCFAYNANNDCDQCQVPFDAARERYA